MGFLAVEKHCLHTVKSVFDMKQQYAFPAKSGQVYFYVSRYSGWGGSVYFLSHEICIR